jgi:hypothetical protein
MLSRSSIRVPARKQTVKDLTGASRFIRSLSQFLGFVEAADAKAAEAAAVRAFDLSEEKRKRLYARCFKRFQQPDVPKLQHLWRHPLFRHSALIIMPGSPCKTNCLCTSADDVEPRTRSARPCRSPAMPNGRCRMHGGLSPGAPKGNKNALKHGRYTAKAIARRRDVSGLLRAMKALAGEM